jgi:hypothetical protein
MPCPATSQAGFFDFDDAVSIFCGFACHPRQAVLLLQLFIPAWISGSLGALYDLFHELLKRVRKVILQPPITTSYATMSREPHRSASKRACELTSSLVP